MCLFKADTFPIHKNLSINVKNKFLALIFKFSLSMPEDFCSMMAPQLS